MVGPRLLLTSARRYVSLILQTLTSPWIDGRRIGATLLLLLGLPLFILWQLLHWLGFLLDEIFFRGYRQVAIREPVFVLGPPRSGTTHLHHVLSGDPRTTTFRTWECLFGISVTGRKLCLALGAVDRRLGRPLSRIAGWIGGSLLGALDDVHPLGLEAPEEDFLCLMPPAACFLLIVPFPRARWLWRIARFDSEVPAAERRVLMAYYRACIQKHLYVFGTDKRFLSKNASFSGMAQSLLDEFPDARILACIRDPMATVPSQLSALRPSLAWSGFGFVSDSLRDRLVDLLAYYYMHLADTAERNPGRLAFVDNAELRDQLQSSVTSALTEVGIPPDTELEALLQDAARRSRDFRSGHRYSLEEFGLDPDLLRSQFAPVYARYSFGRSSNA